MRHVVNRVLGVQLTMITGTRDGRVLLCRDRNWLSLLTCSSISRPNPVPSPFSTPFKFVNLIRAMSINSFTMARLTESSPMEHKPSDHISSKSPHTVHDSLLGSSREQSDVEKLHNRTGLSPEKPKVALQQWPGAGFWAMNFVAIALTFILYYLNFKRVYWFDVDGYDGTYVPQGTVTTWIERHFNIPYNTFLKALLLGGKAHEIALVGSLVAVVIHLTRRKLLTGPGLPLGMFPAGNGQLGYLLSREFRKTMLLERKLALFLVSSALISVLVSSIILVQ
jgi:hypothetical protein